MNKKGQNRGCTATAMCTAYSIYHDSALSPNDVKWSTAGTSWEYCKRYKENKPNGEELDWRERSSGISSDTVIAAWSRYSYKNQEEEKNEYICNILIEWFGFNG